VEDAQRVARFIVGELTRKRQKKSSALVLAPDTTL
jgi:hypothetical protein